MSRLFFGILAFLVAFTIYLVSTQPEQQTDRPVLYWKTDPNPQRVEQIKLFHKWLIKHGYVDGQGKPVVELKVDSANSQSKLIQAVSGVAGDIMDAPVRSYEPMGVLTDITKYARELDFGLNQTYPGLANSLIVNGRQYGYPCNVNVIGLWCNVDTFEKLGMKAPPEKWDLDAFEKIGREFVKRANKGKKRQDVFFSQSPVGNWQGERFIATIYRSQGLDDFNETCTRVILNDPRYVATLKRLYKWTFEYHLFPSASEESSMSAEAGYGGNALSHFKSGKFGMMTIGRWALIRMREFKNMPKISLSQFPQMDFENMVISARVATLYMGSKHKKYAKLFFAFLADKEYNDYIISDADGLPPNPKFTFRNPDFEKPKKWPQEALTNNIELKWARTIALGSPYSPYYKNTGTDWKRYGMEKYFNNRATAEYVAAEIEQRMNESIDTTVKRNPELKKRYNADCELQKKIDKYKREGRKLRASWIKNPYYLKYYRSRGMIKEEKRN